MRGTHARVLIAVALGVTMASTTACLPGAASADAKAACDKMQTEIAGIPSKAQGMASNPAAVSQVYTDAANNIRSEAKKAGGDVEAAAKQVATDLDGLANTLRQAAAGNPQTPDTESLISSGAKLKVACT